MRLLPWDYGVRNLQRRPLRTVLTALGLTLVVFLLLLVVSFLRGLDVSLQQSGDEQVVLLHSIAAAENLENSSISDQVPALVRSELAPHLLNVNEVPALSPELLVSTILGPQAEGATVQQTVLRGVRPEVFLVRRKAFIIEGQFPKRGEILLGKMAVAKLGTKPEDLAVGKTLEIEKATWRISGHFAAPNTFLEGEIWCPLDDLKQHVKRPNDISLVAIRMNQQGNRKQQLDDIDYFCRFRHRDLEVFGSPEVEYYGSLRRHYEPMRGLAWLLVLLVGIAGACGAINTMYAAVAGRVREFAALQCIGFPRHAIGISLLQESVLLSTLATLAATVLAVLLLQGVAIRFPMGAFTLRLDPTALLVGAGTGVALGIIGAIPPALRAFRLPLAMALKAV